MKKLCFAIIIVISFLIVPLSTYTLAAEMTAGVSTWYTKWVFPDNNNNMEMDPGFMYGPVLSVRFSENWSIAGVFLYGRFKQQKNGSGDGGSDEISRYDSDISLNYNFNRYFKIFGGGKFLAFSWDDNGATRMHWSAGPGLGIGATLPLSNNFFLLCNASGTYTFGKHDESSNSGNNTTTINITETGLNTNVSLAYYIGSASTSVNLGFRYQYLHTIYGSNNNNKTNESFYFYGVTLSAVYSF